MTPDIHSWLPPAGFAAAVPALARYPLPAISHTLARLATTAPAVLDAGDHRFGTVWVVAPSHVLLVAVTGEANTGEHQRHVHLPPPLSGSAAGSMPVPVVDVDTLTTALDEPSCGHLWAPGGAPHRDGWAHRAVTTLVTAAGAAREALRSDAEEDPRFLLPALAGTLNDLAEITDGLGLFCGDFTESAGARLALATTLLADAAVLVTRAHVDVTDRIDIDPRLPDLRLTEIVVCPQRSGASWAWRAVAHLADRRTGQNACHATLSTDRAYPSVAAAIDAVRDNARHWNVARPDPTDPPPQLSLFAPGPPDPGWAAQLATQAERLRLRLVGPPAIASRGHDPAPPAAPDPEPDIAGYADLMLASIDEDIADGGLPGSVANLADVNDYVDGNCYLDDAGVPVGTDAAANDLVATVQAEVNRRLAAPGRPHCTHGACTYPRHDHTTTVGPDGEDLDEPIPMRCGHCGLPAHYDAKLQRERHDDPAAPDCFLVSRYPNEHRPPA